MVRERKKKAGPLAGSDFKKKKAKVGKKALAARSATSTQFKSKRIAMPEQSVLKVSHSETPTDARGRDLLTLVSQTRHYAAPVRSEAIQGMIDVVEKYSGILDTQIRPIILTTLERFTDDDDTVRSKVMSLVTAIVERTHASALVPFADRVLAYLTSALTSLERGIRVDGLVILHTIFDTSTGRESIASGRTAQALSHADYIQRLLPAVSAILKASGSASRGSMNAMTMQTGVLAAAQQSSDTSKQRSVSHTTARTQALLAMQALLRPSIAPASERKSPGLAPHAASPVVRFMDGSDLRGAVEEGTGVHAAFGELFSVLHAVWLEADAAVSNAQANAGQAMTELALIAEVTHLALGHLGGTLEDVCAHVLAGARVAPSAVPRVGGTGTAAAATTRMMRQLLELLAVCAQRIPSGHSTGGGGAYTDETDDSDSDGDKAMRPAPRTSPLQTSAAQRMIEHVVRTTIDVALPCALSAGGHPGLPSSQASVSAMISDLVIAEDSSSQQVHAGPGKKRKGAARYSLAPLSEAVEAACEFVVSELSSAATVGDADDASPASWCVRCACDIIEWDLRVGSEGSGGARNGRLLEAQVLHGAVAAVYMSKLGRAIDAHRARVDAYAAQTSKRPNKKKRRTTPSPGLEGGADLDPELASTVAHVLRIARCEFEAVRRSSAPLTHATKEWCSGLLGLVPLLVDDESSRTQRALAAEVLDTAQEYVLCAGGGDSKDCSDTVCELLKSSGAALVSTTELLSPLLGLLYALTAQAFAPALLEGIEPLLHEASASDTSHLLTLMHHRRHLLAPSTYLSMLLSTMHASVARAACSKTPVEPHTEWCSVLAVAELDRRVEPLLHRLHTLATPTKVLAKIAPELTSWLAPAAGATSGGTPSTTLFTRAVAMVMNRMLPSREEDPDSQAALERTGLLEAVVSGVERLLSTRLVVPAPRIQDGGDNGDHKPQVADDGDTANVRDVTLAPIVELLMHPNCGRQALPLVLEICADSVLSRNRREGGDGAGNAAGVAAMLLNLQFIVQGTSRRVVAMEKATVVVNVVGGGSDGPGTGEDGDGRQSRTNSSEASGTTFVEALGGVWGGFRNRLLPCLKEESPVVMEASVKTQVQRLCDDIAEFL